jgi:enterochelin esterase family protein
MECLPDTNVWFKTRIMRSDTRTTYQLAPDPLPEPHHSQVPFIPDPLNPRQYVPFCDEQGFRIKFSLLELPDVSEPAWVHSDAAMKNVKLHTPFEDRRRIWVYQPDTAQSCDSVEHTLLIMFDGRLAKDILDLPSMLQEHMAKQAIRPTIALMIDSEDRSELACKKTFATYIAERVIPWARSTFPVSGLRERTVVAGSSFGGLCAVYVALHYPMVVGRVISPTGWFRWHPEGAEPVWLAREVIARSVEAVDFYMDVGNLENARMRDGGPSQLDANRHMRDVLCAKGYPVLYREFSGGHDYSSISAPLYEALPHMLGV